MNTLYKIHVASAGTSRNNIETVVGRYFTGFTAYKATGHWEGQVEACVVIEILVDTDTPEEAKIRELVKALKSQFVQDKVLVIQLPCEASFE
jgi:hypothetical protein